MDVSVALDLASVAMLFVHADLLSRGEPWLFDSFVF